MIIDVLIEDPKGSTERHVRDRSTGEWRTYTFPHTSQPWPASYGFVRDTLNPIDGDELDVLLLSTSSLETGAAIRARAVGMILRPDGDHKILAVECDESAFRHVRTLADVPPGEIRAIETWFSGWSTLGDWADERQAAAQIARARRHATTRQPAQ